MKKKILEQYYFEIDSLTKNFAFYKDENSLDTPIDAENVKATDLILHFILNYQQGPWAPGVIKNMNKQYAKEGKEVKIEKIREPNIYKLTLCEK